MQYTLRNVPEEVDRKLRERAQILGVSLNEAVIRALKAATGVGAPPPEPTPDPHPLDEFRGVWKDEPWVEGFVQDLADLDAISLEVKTLP
ncbi:FitA-like ribbon-helix-helix domain-containing protein [Phycisphaera mikurensis]|uniref:Antitoxin FitA-like ribbon-helix-helix domain-containing protein n=1 Tax=Phycisphaera mikurensis (strain NBRC 102666 / KCTC 22515 / FYK2301M01) TaxID=1142394 RepID=I0IJA5_PHYMF|nr:hypothetical protein [Phycisphaera mikurensis]MBB6441857.1 hypothetical protein [Phycisphaera mikurensis]BAM05343.1 hypothetical protein PSMK_31840 [Phycisphaera mikurensis NBRC 102666]